MTRASLALLVAGALSGCTLTIDPPRTPPMNACGEDADCGGSRCDREMGICVAETAAPYAFNVQMVLPASIDEGRPALVTSSGSFAASGVDASIQIAVRAPVPVTGWVREGGTRPVEADVVFAPRTSVLVPVAPRLSVSTPGVETAGMEPMRAHEFATQLVPGLVYDVEVRPRGEDARRLAPTRAVLELMGGQRYDVTLRPNEEHFRLAGTLVDLVGTGHDGLEVRAIDETGRLVSSVATTSTMGEDEGVFELFVDPAATNWRLVVSAPPAYQAAAAFPTITVDPAVLVYEGPTDDPRVRVLVPTPDQTGACFAGTVEMPAGGAAVGATITLRSRQLEDDGTGLTGTFALQLTTSAGAAAGTPIGCSLAPLPPGGFEARVLPGEYDIEIRPLEPELGVYVEHRRITDDTVGPVFVLPERARLSGILQRSAGEPVFDARVRAVPLNAPLPGPRLDEASLLNRPNETITDPLGNFRLLLDVGVYDLIAEPAEGSGWPWVVRPAFAMAAREWTEVLDVGHPIAVRGQASFDDGALIAGAEITAYAIVGERAVPIGRATSDAEGRFLLLLPPELR
ncbi:hypothetical protein [Sandaracinus amylolyticus]|uniref:Carboxypeptidase regulatory-like domain-containing protein n=1 Tax=Sandaracinus amylolyticus TaxID=927083 RepID=A0A0F6YLX5_9BACT|nr:hypothetical protein [Sandaracinus amylolyticus]AKF10413.1 hypothetical protein DB32_007562 [Sandaracinus amylolyticus]